MYCANHDAFYCGLEEGVLNAGENGVEKHWDAEKEQTILILESYSS